MVDEYVDKLFEVAKSFPIDPLDRRDVLMRAGSLAAIYTPFSSENEKIRERLFGTTAESECALGSR